MSFALLRHYPPHPWVSVPEDNDNDAMNTIFLSQLLLNSLIIMSTTTAAAKQLAYASSHGASSTSIYTTEEKQDSYQTLEEVLEAKCADPLVRQVIQDLMKVCADITDALRVALVTVEGSTNDFGDSQLSVDVSVGFLWEACRVSSVIREGASEEEPVVRNMDEEGNGEFTVCWDPL